MARRAGRDQARETRRARIREVRAAETVDHFLACWDEELPPSLPWTEILGEALFY